MMHIEAWSRDVSFHGDGVAKQATINLIGFPFNLDLSESGFLEVSAEGMISAGPPEEMFDLECELNPPLVTIKFPEPIQDRESMVVRIRMKMGV
jgi:hypothetical protein